MTWACIPAKVGASVVGDADSVAPAVGLLFGDCSVGGSSGWVGCIVGVGAALVGVPLGANNGVLLGDTLGA